MSELHRSTSDYRALEAKREACVAALKEQLGRYAALLDDIRTNDAITQTQREMLLYAWRRDAPLAICCEAKGHASLDVVAEPPARGACPPLTS